MRVPRATDPNAEHVRMLGPRMALPEDLRSDLLKSYGRGELENYRRNLLRAVEIWRQRGIWRVPIDEG